jgi:hypothetical protein
MTTLVIEIFSRRSVLRGKRWYFRVKSTNGEIVAQSEAYQNKGDCIGTAHTMRARLFDASLRTLD